MEKFIDRPQSGFATPYQLLLGLVAGVILNKSIDTPAGNNPIADKWGDITENDVNITEPVRVVSKDTVGWKCYISSETRNIAKVPVKFYPMELPMFLKQMLISTEFGLHYLGREIKEEGFYLSGGRGELVLVVKYNYDFKKGIMFSGLEFKPSMFQIINNKQIVKIDCPVVTGTMQIMYID